MKENCCCTQCEVESYRAEAAMLREALKQADDAFEKIHDDWAEPSASAAGGQIANICLIASLSIDTALSGSSGEWLEKKIADAIAEKFSQERSMVCTYCGHKTVGEGLSAEDFDAKWKQHMLYCEARPEVKLLNALCYIADKYGVPDDSEPEAMKSARDWLARQLADAKREAPEAAAERIESIFGVGISGAPEELRQMAQEVPNA